MYKLISVLMVMAFMFQQSDRILARSKVLGKDVQYEADGVVLKGYLAYDTNVKMKSPGVLVVHEWWGLNDYARMRARMLASLGYTALALDMYGEGKQAAHPADAIKFSSEIMKNFETAKIRFNAAMDYLKGQPTVDPDRIGAIGYCFGGTTVLELARSGADVKGVASFHGTLDTPNPADAKNIKGSVLILQGADDPYVPIAQRTAFQDEMEKGGVDWQMNIYGHAVHSFTNPASGNDKPKGLAYNMKADKRSWEAMKLFFKEIFAR